MNSFSIFLHQFSRTFPLLIVFLLGNINSGYSADVKPAYSKYENPELNLSYDQYAKFPSPLTKYEKIEGSIGEKLKSRTKGKLGAFNVVASIIFLLAIIHTFLAGIFTEMAYKEKKKHKELIEKEGRRAVDKPEDNARDDQSFNYHLFHFLGEVEAVFGIWVVALAGAVLYFFGFQQGDVMEGVKQLQLYLGKDVNFTEPLFVIVIMGIAATRPVVRFAENLVNKIAGLFGGSDAAWWFAALTVTPILGSFITEPAAMTIAAMLLAKKFFEKRPSPKFAYATLGLLFVNISVGGTLTHFAAPPVLMVASKWHWGTEFMMMNFGWKAVIGILAANTLYFFYFKKEFSNLAKPILDSATLTARKWEERENPIPPMITIVHLGFLAWTVVMSHYPALFIGGFLFFIGFTEATGHHQNDVKMRTPLLVGFFLAALVIHGRCQAWWIEVLLTSIDNIWILMIGSTVLTAFNDNAAITFLASQAPGLSDIAKYAVVAGAVTGGGLTVIANAPNPAGQSILSKYFNGRVSPAKLALAAIIPTMIMGAAFMLLPSKGMYSGVLHHNDETGKMHTQHVIGSESKIEVAKHGILILSDFTHEN